ncbi:MAG TPA: DUF885 family protein [Sphingomicrobium sp.]|nr:DUF885 family protein [Sphingomicrobium sp.]
MFEIPCTRRQTLAGLAAATALPGVPGTAFASPLDPGAEARANALLDSVADNLLRLYPEQATGLGIDKGDRAALRSQLTDRSGIGQQRIAQTVRADLARVNAVDVAPLSHSTRTSIEVVRSAYATALEGFMQPYGDAPVTGDSWRKTPYVVLQNTGAYLDIPRFLDSEHRIESADDAEAYLARLAQYPQQLDNELGRVIAYRYKGLIPPAFLIDTALGTIKQSADGARRGGGLVDSIERRTREKHIPGNWAERARAIAEKEVAPALERQLAELNLQRGLATNEAGMWARPNGEEYYRWALRAQTTTDKSPDEVHRIGLDTLQSLHGEMDAILKRIGYSKGSVGERMKALAKDPRYRFPDNDAGRAQIMAFIQQRLTAIRARMPQAFNTLVRGNVEVRRLPLEEEPGAAGAYGGAGSIDGTIPGKFWINLKPGFEHRRYNLPTLVHHEAIPGHVWQGEYANKLPLIRTLLSFNAYSEGWALYSEQLAGELGSYDGDEVGRLGYLDSIAFRAARLVVDTGLHAKRWTREQARHFFDEQTGDPNESEVDRYCSWPGQACGYEMGHQEINRQRDKARVSLGARYDLKAFDDAVVLGGNVPMDVLAKNVDDYIARAKV